MAANSAVAILELFMNKKISPERASLSSPAQCVVRAIKTKTTLGLLECTCGRTRICQNSFFVRVRSEFREMCVGVILSEYAERYSPNGFNLQYFTFTQRPCSTKSFRLDVLLNSWLFLETYFIFQNCVNFK